MALGMALSFASSEIMGGDTAAIQPRRRRRAAARPRRPSLAASSATSQRFNRRYDLWSVQDELVFLNTLADLREVNEEAVIPRPSLIRDELRRGKRAFSRGELRAEDVAEKMRNLKNQFKKAVANVVAAGNGGGNSHPTRFEKHRELYEMALKVWPELGP